MEKSNCTVKNCRRFDTTFKFNCSCYKAPDRDCKEYYQAQVWGWKKKAELLDKIFDIGLIDYHETMDFLKEYNDE